MKQIERAIALGLKNAAKCEVDPPLKNKTFPVTITVSPDGRLRANVGAAVISESLGCILEAKPEGECIPDQFSTLLVPAFDGPAVVVKRSLKTTNARAR
ncbi:MAG: hypothetical protein KF850_10155 [Labilithrix sp.]|nr:hypothetical protein [Labilithrix sp.]MBX3212384.1 hypothetical protein [Labilithrix sp.]